MNEDEVNAERQSERNVVRERKRTRAITMKQHTKQQ